MLSRINSLVKDATDSCENLDLFRLARDLSAFIADDLSRLYIKLVRSRIRSGDTRPLSVLHRKSSFLEVPPDYVIGRRRALRTAA